MLYYIFIIKISKYHNSKEYNELHVLSPGFSNINICHILKEQILLFLPLMNCAKGLAVGIVYRCTFCHWTLPVPGPCPVHRKINRWSLDIFNSLWENPSLNGFFMSFKKRKALNTKHFINSIICICM